MLHGIDLVVRSGEVHVIMGPNGSGKSTLAHALMGRPGTEVTEGSITMDGQELTALPAWQRARAGLFLALQHPVEVPGVGLHSLLHAAAPDGATAAALTARMADEAKAVGLDPKLLQRPLNVDLSGGEAKRTEMVQLGVLRPAISILDEVDSGLDVDALGEVARGCSTPRTSGVLASSPSRTSTGSSCSSRPTWCTSWSGDASLRRAMQTWLCSSSRRGTRATRTFAERKLVRHDIRRVRDLPPNA